MDDCRQCVRCGSKCVEDYCPPCAGRRIAELEATIEQVRAACREGASTADHWVRCTNAYAPQVAEDFQDAMVAVQEAIPTPTPEGSNASGGADDSQGGEG